jgi:predicted RNA polymerase sigma factor
MTSAGQEEVWRRCAPHVLAALVRRYGDFDAAEDAVQEALLAAARQWPTDGMPDNPRGWLITVASRRLADQWRAEQARTDREQLIARHTPPEAFLAAVAVAKVDGPTAALAMLEPLLQDRQLRRHHRLHAVHAHLLEMDGRVEEARAAYATAARLATSIPEQRYLNTRAAQRAPV